MHWIKKVRITTKFVGSIAALFGGVALFIALFFPARQEAQMMRYLDEQAATLALTIAHGAGAGLFFEDATSVNASLEALAEVEKVRFALIYGESGAVVGAHRQDDAAAFTQRIEAELGGAEVHSSRMGDLWITHAPVVFNGARIGEIVLATSLQSVQADVAANRWVALLAGLAIAIIGSLLFAGLTLFIVRPIKKLETAALAVAGGDVDVTVAVETQDEIGTLAGAFNRMVENIRHSLAEVQHKSDEAEAAAEAARQAGAEAQAQRAYLTERVEVMLEEMDRFAEGDLSVSLTAERDDDIGRLYDGFNRAVGTIRQMLQRVEATVGSAAQSTDQINEATHTLRVGADEQARQAVEVAAAVEEMSRTIIENAQTATMTAEIATGCDRAAREGGQVVRQTVQMMHRIAAGVRETAQTVEGLGDASRQIGEITSVIDDIASQTNLLALNAAIEAARAGEQGRGFAVVADEVRKLAERTSQATRQITEMIKTIQAETQKSVHAIRTGADEATDGLKLADQTGTALDKIVTEVERLIDMINQIAAASEEQSATSEEIARSVTSIQQVSTSSRADIGGVSQSVDYLHTLMSELTQQVHHFRLDADDRSGDGMPWAPRQAPATVPHPFH